MIAQTSTTSAGNHENYFIATYSPLCCWTDKKIRPNQDTKRRQSPSHPLRLRRRHPRTLRPPAKQNLPEQLQNPRPPLGPTRDSLSFRQDHIPALRMGRRRPTHQRRRRLLRGRVRHHAGGVAIRHEHGQHGDPLARGSSRAGWHRQGLCACARREIEGRIGGYGSEGRRCEVQDGDGDGNIVCQQGQVRERVIIMLGVHMPPDTRLVSRSSSHGKVCDCFSFLGYLFGLKIMQRSTASGMLFPNPFSG